MEQLVTSLCWSEKADVIINLFGVIHISTRG